MLVSLEIENPKGTLIEYFNGREFGSTPPNILMLTVSLIFTYGGIV